MKKIILALFNVIFILNCASANEGITQETSLQETHAGNSLIIECKITKKPCTIKIKNINNQSTTFSDFIDINKIGITWHGDNLVELRRSLGTNASFSKFYDFKRMRGAKKEYPGVIAIDAAHNLVAYCDSYLVLVDNLFDDKFKLITISRPYAGSTESSVYRNDSRFTKTGDLQLSYMAIINKRYEERDELVNLP
ncbi:MAG: hypothetical protein HY939_01615 [Gammaproteobacteria bacterium]|nr:hypothetical protein [Gammaproteobacteria bacterium]